MLYERKSAQTQAYVARYSRSCRTRSRISLDYDGQPRQPIESPTPSLAPFDMLPSFALLACIPAPQIHPSDLKPAVADALNAILQPVRDHFSRGDAKKLLETVRKYKTTR